MLSALTHPLMCLTQRSRRVRKGAGQQAADFVGECFRLAAGDRAKQQACKRKDGVKNVVSTALGKDNVTQTDVEKYIQKGARTVALNSIESCNEGASPGRTGSCLDNAEVREQGGRALGREDNITKVELNDIVRKGAAAPLLTSVATASAPQDINPEGTVSVRAQAPAQEVPWS